MALSTDTHPKRRRPANGASPKCKKLKDEEQVSDVAMNDGTIENLERRILDSRKSYNDITQLFDKARNGPEFQRGQALNALCRVFCHLLAAGDLNISSGSTEADIIVVKWLSSHLDNLWELVGQCYHLKSTAESQHLLKLLLQLLKEESLAGTKPPIEVLMSRADGLFFLLAVHPDTQLQAFYVAEYASKYLDLAYTLARGIQQIFEARSEVSFLEKGIVSEMGGVEDFDRDSLLDRAIPILQHLKNAQPTAFWISASSDGASSGRQPTLTHQTFYKAVGNSWLAVLSKNLDKHQRKAILKLIPTGIAPLLKKPEKLLDFLIESFDQGGSMALLALHGLFYLIQEKNLDYPQFYRKVYSMLDASILHSKHRSNFLRLLEKFLASSHLPAVLVASFLKRLARLSLFAPPAAIAFVAPLTYNLLKNHPMCTFMIHRTSTGQDTDPFDMDEEDPMESGALESSLWELHTLHSHYHSNVSIIARVISEQFTKPAYNLEDFLDHSYASMLESDLTKSIKKEPVIEYRIPKTIFPEQRRDLTASDDVLELWGFEG